MNFYRFAKCLVPFLRPLYWRSGKADYKGWGTLQREATVTSTASLLQLSEVDGCLQKVKSQKQLGRTDL